jgi:K+-transporting ATPase ATPase C chain
MDALKAADPGNTLPIPVDLVTASASGLDPGNQPGRRALPGWPRRRGARLSAEQVLALIDATSRSRCSASSAKRA